MGIKSIKRLSGLFLKWHQKKALHPIFNPCQIKLEVPNKDKLLAKISAGSALIVIRDRTFLLDFRLVKNNEVQDTTIEPTVHGPQKGLSEDIDTTINLIRQRYHKSSLKVEEIVTDDESRRTVALLYDNDLVDPEVLKKIKEKLEDLHTPLFQSAGELQHFLNKSRWTLFPTTLVTERPDRIVYNLVGGKVIIAIDGSPNVIIAPVIFFDFMSSMEDNYHVSALITDDGDIKIYRFVYMYFSSRFICSNDFL